MSNLSKFQTLIIQKEMTFNIMKTTSDFNFDLFHLFQAFEQQGNIKTREQREAVN